MFSQWLFCFVTLSFAIQSYGESRVAVALLNRLPLPISENITGRILFTEIDGGIQVSGTIRGLPQGHYGFHIHQLGDITTCDMTGAHFNPDDTDHGGQNHTVRHVGDLGNVVFVGNETAVANVQIFDPVISLTGRNSILGRALVLHENEDDLGQGGHELSLTTGNAGPRVACGVIGILSPADPWNSAVIPAPSLSILTVIMFIAMRVGY